MRFVHQGLKFKLSNEKKIFPPDNVIFRNVACPFPGFRAKGVILNLPHCDVKIKFISRDVPRESYAHRLKAIKICFLNF